MIHDLNKWPGISPCFLGDFTMFWSSNKSLLVQDVSESCMWEHASKFQLPHSTFLDLQNSLKEGEREKSREIYHNRNVLMSKL